MLRKLNPDLEVSYVKEIIPDGQQAVPTPHTRGLENEQSRSEGRVLPGHSANRPPGPRSCVGQKTRLEVRGRSCPTDA